MMNGISFEETAIAIASCSNMSVTEAKDRLHMVFSDLAMGAAIANGIAEGVIQWHTSRRFQGQRTSARRDARRRIKRKMKRS